MARRNKYGGVGGLPKPRRSVPGGGISRGRKPGMGAGRTAPFRRTCNDPGHHPDPPIRRRIVYHCPCPDQWNHHPQCPNGDGQDFRPPQVDPGFDDPGNDRPDDNGGHGGGIDPHGIITAPPQPHGLGWHTNFRAGHYAREGHRDLTFKGRRHKKVMGKLRRPLTLTAKAHAQTTGWY